MKAPEHISFYQVQALVAQMWTAPVWRDPERLHGLEDDIHVRVLQTIADGAAEDPTKLAAEALTTREAPGERWYA